MQLFYSLPFASVMRVWDYVLCEGYQVSFFLALSILNYYQGIMTRPLFILLINTPAKLLKMEFSDIVVFLKSLDSRPEEFDVDRIIKDSVRFMKKAKQKGIDVEK